MTLDEEFLGKARAAEGRMIDAERNAEVARADFHHAVRRLQLAGGSLREIADALGLSHQRVHQIVEGAGGSRPWRMQVRRHKPPEQGNMDTKLLCCSFCGNPQTQVAKLIAGPEIYICNGCVDTASRVVATGEPAVTPLSEVASLGEDAAAKCGFCGKRRHQVPGVAAAGPATVCSECLELCQEILREELA